MECAAAAGERRRMGAAKKRGAQWRQSIEVCVYLCRMWRYCATTHRFKQLHCVVQPGRHNCTAASRRRRHISQLRTTGPFRAILVGHASIGLYCTALYRVHSTAVPYSWLASDCPSHHALPRIGRITTALCALQARPPRIFPCLHNPNCKQRPMSRHHHPIPVLCSTL